MINKEEEQYATTGDKPTYISSSSSIEGKIKISSKNNDVNLLLECIRQNKKLTLHHRIHDRAVGVVPFSGYHYYNNVYFYDTLHIINFFAKEILVYPNEDYSKKFVPYDEYENDFKNRIKVGNGLITDVSRATVISGIKDIAWDDIRVIRIEESERIIKNKSDEEIDIKEGYYFRFFTRQDVFKNEFYGDNFDKLFQIFYKDKNGNPYILSGYIDYINIQEDMNDLGDSYIQIFLKDYNVREDKAALIKQACNLKKEDVKELEKTLLTNDCILQPFTQKLNKEEEGVVLSENINIQNLSGSTITASLDYNPNVGCCTSSIDYGSVTFGDYTFSPKEVGQALKSLVDDYKTKIKENKEDEIIHWEKAVCKEEFCISNNPCANITYVNPITMEPFSIGTIIEKGQAYYRLTGTSWKEFTEWNKENNKEDKSMFNKIFDKYKFGEVKTNNIAYTINGLAFKGADGTYAVYKDGTLTNVGDMIIDMPIFVMPTSLKSIEIGDVIVHYGVGTDAFVIVTAIDKDNITVVDPWSKERKNLIPEKSIFGFDFVAKVITPMGMFEKQANVDNPFGNMLPFMMMGDGDNKDMMMLMMMSQGNINNQMLPLMFMGKGDNDILKYMMLTQMNDTEAGTNKE